VGASRAQSAAPREGPRLPPAAANGLAARTPAFFRPLPKSAAHAPRSRSVVGCAIVVDQAFGRKICVGIVGLAQEHSKTLAHRAFPRRLGAGIHGNYVKTVALHLGNRIRIRFQNERDKGIHGLLGGSDEQGLKILRYFVPASRGHHHGPPQGSELEVRHVGSDPKPLIGRRKEGAGDHRVDHPALKAREDLR
jgi:hypothetical protein